MAENTKIQWCDHTFNPWIGCAKVSEGCQNCYAEALMADRYGRVVWGVDGTRSRTKTWRDPIKWNRQATEAGEIRKVFCASLADVFEDRPDLMEWRSELFDLIDRCPSLNFLLLTKRPENIVPFWNGTMMRENVWLGTSISNQRNAEECIDKLYVARDFSPVLFLSVEPQIGYVDLEPWLSFPRKVDWVIIGGESKQGKANARPFQIKWAIDGVDQCQAADVPVFVKQMGSNVWNGDKRIHLVDGHGGDMAEWPECIRVRQCPEHMLAS